MTPEEILELVKDGSIKPDEIEDFENLDEYFQECLVNSINNKKALDISSKKLKSNKPKSLLLKIFPVATLIVALFAIFGSFGLVALPSNNNEKIIKVDEIERDVIVKKKMPSYVGQRVDFYATLSQFSTSGDMRFRWWDMEQRRDVFPGNKYTWFFAMPPDIVDDEAANKKWVKFIDDHTDYIYEIIGRREENDCGYYGSDHCIESVTIDQIIPIKLSEELIKFRQMMRAKYNY